MDRTDPAGEADTLTFGQINIDEEKILRIQGYRELSKVRPTIKRAAASAARETEALIQPHVFFRFLNVQICKDGVLVLEDDTRFENEAFDRFLHGADQVAIFILTMGSALDKAVIDRIADDQLLNALFLETAGWLGIEAATKNFLKHLTQRTKAQGLRLSPRLGPGYSYKLDGRSVIWPLEQQQTLFKVFQEKDLDVQLLESCAMLPKFSRSGLFGLLPRTTV